MSKQEQIVVGTLADSKTIDADGGSVQVGSWKGRAIWSFLRLLHGRNIDSSIEAAIDRVVEENKLENKKGAIEYAFEDLLRMPAEKRELQFILEGGEVVAVASLDHSLISPSQIYSIANKVLASMQIPKMTVEQLLGNSYQLQEAKGLVFGLQIHAGTINTRQAITVASMLKINDCCNPLSWLGSGGFDKFIGHGNEHERILRIEKSSEIEPRIKAAIEEGAKGLETLKEKIEKAKETPLNKRTAKILTSAFGGSYSLGLKTVQQIMDQYKKEEATQYGLSMASSWVAAHGKFKNTPLTMGRSVKQKCGTISGVTLMIKDLNLCREKSLEWLREHVRDGSLKSYEKYLKESIQQ